ncbi:hypothetical protein MN608_09852 [Microdochium nivale]|nr:hypothetical protein MN608_09852 [Microdochium nivale]
MDDDKGSEHKIVSPKPVSKKRGRGLQECIRPPFGKWLVLTIVVLVGAGFLCAGASFITTPAHGEDGEKKPDFANLSSVAFSHAQDGVPTLVDTAGEITMTSSAFPTDPFGGVFHEKRDSTGDTDAQYAQGKEGSTQHTMLTTRLTTTSIIKSHFVYNTVQHTSTREAQSSQRSSTMATGVPTGATSVGMVNSPSSTGTDLSEVKYCPMTGSPDVYTLCDWEQRGVSKAPDSAVVASSSSSLVSSSSALKIFRGLASLYHGVRMAPGRLTSAVRPHLC